MTSARIQEEDACYCARNLCFSRIQKGIPGLTHKGYASWERVYLGALSDGTVVLGMRQSIVNDKATISMLIPFFSDIYCNASQSCQPKDGVKIKLFIENMGSKL